MAMGQKSEFRHFIAVGLKSMENLPRAGHYIIIKTLATTCSSRTYLYYYYYYNAFQASTRLFS